LPTPVPPNTVRCNIVWNLPQNEIAVNTIHFKHLHQAANTLDWAGDMTLRYANLVRDGLKSKWGEISANISNSVSVNRVDAYHLGEDGLTIDKATSPATGANALQGAATGTLLPLELTYAVSLYAYDPAAYDPQGGRKRGRIYIPGVPSAAIGGAGRLSTYAGVSSAWAGAFGYMQNRVMDAGPIGLNERAQLVVLSRRFNSTAPVQFVRVDDLLDVQKRRQNKLVPAVGVNHVDAQA
jgi:hypothetical protein